MKNKNKGKNYLKYVPQKHPDIEWKHLSDGNIEVTVTNKGFFNTIAQRYFKRPKQSHIKLDKYGSFIWICINGENDIEEISKKVSQKFGKSAEPLYNRLVRFIEILKQENFITINQ